MLRGKLWRYCTGIDETANVAPILMQISLGVGLLIFTARRYAIARYMLRGHGRELC